jgi:predicted enzyme related to lactoylglutathione lyase
MAKHAICHVEWSSSNLERSRTFYGGLFDWSFTPWGDEYMLFKAPEYAGGGIMKSSEIKPGASPTVYVEVEQIEPYLDQVKKLGGTIAVGKTEIPTVGWFAHLKDPDGNLVGLFQSANKK